MIPKFPTFKKLEQSDRAEVELFVKRFDPYSDFNFVSMWVFDTKEIMELSWLNKNLVVKFQDYLNTKPFFSLLGESEVNKTIKQLIKYSKEKLGDSMLKLVPEIVVEKIIDEKELLVTEDLDNNDYLINIADLVMLKGGKYMKKRNHINGFVRDYGDDSKIIRFDIQEKKVQKNIMDIFLNWETSRGKVREDTEIEMGAINRLFKLKKTNNILCLGLKIKDEIVGFSICELLENKQAIYHFEKANVEYKNIFAYLKHQTAIKLSEAGVLFWNIEQDLGNPGLRVNKAECRPVKMLKKYTVTTGK